MRGHYTARPPTVVAPLRARAPFLVRDWQGAISIEDAHRRNGPELLEACAHKTAIPGVVDVAGARVETEEEIHDHLRTALEHIDAGRLIAAPDCGLGLLTREQVRAKLAAMACAAHAL